MKILRESLLLYAVTDRTWLGDNQLADQVEEILKAGVTLLQLREKEMSFEEFVKEARMIQSVTTRYHVPLIINDRIDVAAAIDADGVHLGQDDEVIENARSILGPHKIIGVSAHSVEEALAAQKMGADYLGVGAVFGTSTKHNANPISYEELKAICKAVTIPVVAIGGITRDNIHKLSGSGIDGIAVISAIFASGNVGKAAWEMLESAGSFLKLHG